MNFLDLDYKDKIEDFRQRYLKYLTGTISYDGGKTFRPVARHPNNWVKAPSHVDLQFAINEVLDKDGDVWVWSDLHFGHHNILGFSDRPFFNIDEMNEAIIENFNDYVKPTDVSIWVGDVAFLNDERANDLLDRCNGYKILVAGNHDFNKGKLKDLKFDEIGIVGVYENERVNLVFSHYPFRDIPDGCIQVHGHEHISTHETSEYGRSLKHINVCCELHEFKPINLKTILTWANARMDSIEVKK